MLRYLLSNYLISAFRSLTRHKMNLALTVFGMSIGLAATFLVALYALNESSYDDFQPDAERTYRVVMKHKPTGNEYPLTTPRGHQYFKKLVGVEDVLALLDAEFFMSYKIKVGSAYLKLDNVMAGPENITDFIDINLLHGDLSEALTQPYKIALSRAEALRLFGTENAIGETFTMEKSGKTLEVLAVFDDFYQNSHYAMKAIIANKHFMEFFGKISHTYVKLHAGVLPNQVAAKVTDILNELWQDETNEIEYYLQPLVDIHLAANFNADMKVGGSEKTLAISISLSILLLLISSFNYINMSIAQAGSRAKEVGVRKVLGASKAQLVLQFLSESIAIALISALLACGLVELLLPSFNGLVGRDLAVGNWSQYLMSIFAITTAIGVISGLYPALFISSFSVHRVLSGDFERGKTAIVVRKAIMVLQSALSVGLIIGAASLYQQLHYLQNLSVNYQKEQRLKLLEMPSDKIYATDSQQLYQDLVKIDGVISATPTDFDLTDSTNAGAFVSSVPGVAEFDVVMGYAGVGFNAAKTLGLNLIAGRDFLPEYQSDWFNETQGTIGIFIPESVLAIAGYATPEEAIGNVWRFGAGGQENLKGKIIGVFKDVKIGSSKQSASPVLFACGLAVGGEYSLLVAVDDQHSVTIQQEVIAFLEQRLGLNAIELQLVKNNYQLLYQTENRLVQMVSVFSGLAVLLTCVGMFGLAAFSAQQRKREVAIRKVLGASRLSLMMLLTGESIALVMLSLTMAYPTAYYFINSWLNTFNDRITQSVFIYTAAAVVVACVTWLTVATIAIRAASLKPSISLRAD